MIQAIPVALGFLLLSLGLFVFLIGFMDWYDERLLECTPISRCRGVALGRVVLNLVSVCRGYMEHESSVMQAVTASRSQWANARGRADKLTAAAIALPPLRQLLATAESYPRLRANENFLQLQEQLTSLEGQIADRRELYNSAVSLFNSRIQLFPDRMVANAFRFRAQPFYWAEDAVNAVPSAKTAQGS